MAGLIYKDFVNLKQQAKIYLLIVVVWMAVSIAEGNLSFFGGMMAVFSVLLPLTCYAYDEQGQWDKYALTMPISRKEIVLSKYVFGLVMLGCSLLLTMAVSAATKQDVGEAMEVHCIFAALGIFCMAVIFPSVFRFGVEKARNIMFLCFLIPAAVAMLWEKMDFAAPTPQLAERLTYLAPVAAIVLLLISIPLSISIYEKREF